MANSKINIPKFHGKYTNSFLSSNLRCYAYLKSLYILILFIRKKYVALSIFVLRMEALSNVKIMKKDIKIKVKILFTILFANVLKYYIYDFQLQIFSLKYITCVV